MEKMKNMEKLKNNEKNENMILETEGNPSLPSAIARGYGKKLLLALSWDQCRIFFQKIMIRGPEATIMRRSWPRGSSRANHLLEKPIPTFTK